MLKSFLDSKINPVNPKGNNPGYSLEEWCWSWNSNTLATWCEEPTHWKRPWCWERLRVRGEGDDRGWDGWMASLTQWTWVWVGSGSWWWTGKPGVLLSMGSQSVGHNWATELIDWGSKYSDCPHTGKKALTFSNLIMLAVSSWHKASTFNCTCDPRPDGAVCL